MAASAGGRRHVFICIVLPSVLFGIAIGSYFRSMHQLAVFMPGSVGVLRMDAPIASLGAGHFASSSNETAGAARLGQPDASTSMSATAPDNNTSQGTKESDYMYQSPVESMLPSFPNRIVGKEVVKHDRLVVDSLAYINSFKSAQTYLDLMEKEQTDAASVTGHLLNKQEQQQQQQHQAARASPVPLTLVFLTVNRAVPYIAVALTSLIRGHTPEIFVERLNVHVCNPEKRQDRVQTFHLFETLKERFPFLTFHSWNMKYPELKSVKGYNVFMEEQRRDYVKALKICNEAADMAGWCAIFEDDTLFPARFAQKFDKIIGSKDVLESAALGGSNETIQIKKSKLLMVKLYNNFNDPLSKERNLYSEEYIREGYESDRAITAVEANEKGKTTKEVNFSFQLSLSGYGIVSNAYPLSSIGPLIEYLETAKFQIGQATDTTINFSYQMKSKKKVLEATPSLVNHIGFYSENQAYNAQGAALSKSLSTDVRFNIDDGHRRRR